MNRQHHPPVRTPTKADIYPCPCESNEQLIVMERLRLYNAGQPCGAVALRRHLDQRPDVCPVPSVRHIQQVLNQYGLTYGRTGWYEGEDLDWLPASAQVPTHERRCVILARHAAP